MYVELENRFKASFDPPFKNLISLYVHPGWNEYPWQSKTEYMCIRSTHTEYICTHKSEIPQKFNRIFQEKKKQRPQI